MATQRQLQVGEEIRHALSTIINRGESAEPILFEANITVTAVDISPDLKSARVFVMPLGGKMAKKIMEALTRAAPFFRHQLAKEIVLRHVPTLKFVLDETFDNAARIASLLKNKAIED